MNWLHRARREISERADQPTANSAERNPTAAMAVMPGGIRKELGASFGGNGSEGRPLPESEELRDAFEERAAIMEFDGGMNREEAEWEAHALAVRRQLH
jgi:hypothetical protein